MDETKYWLWLNMVFGTGNHRIWEVMSFFRTAEKAYAALCDGSAMVSLNEVENKNVHDVPLRNAEIFLENCARHGISVICFKSPEYPERLKHIYNPPSVLYCKGNVSCLNTEPAVTSVGTRKASVYSIKAAKAICSELSARGAVIVSGFAVGTDIACSLAAAEMGRPTICVMGCGVDVDYPKQNFAYRDTILAAGGVFISEFPPATQPYSPNFPKRNRVLAALGNATVVFQAGIRSGALITANLAAGQGREVLCLPPADILCDDYSGNVKLLRDGAVPMYDASDVILCIGGRKEQNSVHETMKTFAEKMSDHDDVVSDTTYEYTSTPADFEVSGNAEKPHELPDELSSEQKRIAEALENGALHADELAQLLGIDTSELMTELTELEIFGVVRSLPGKMFELLR